MGEFLKLNALADEYVGNEELSLLKIALPSLLADAEYLEDFSILVKETLEQNEQKFGKEFMLFDFFSHFTKVPLRY